MTRPVTISGAPAASAGVAVIGTGTMGAGIAPVAARAGHLPTLEQPAEFDAAAEHFLGQLGSPIQAGS